MEAFSFLKLLGGFNIFSGAKLAKLIFYAVLILSGIGIYHKTFIEPKFKYVTDNKQTVTRADKVENHYEQITLPKSERFSLIKIGNFRLLSYE